MPVCSDCANEGECNGWCKKPLAKRKAEMLEASRGYAKGEWGIGTKSQRAYEAAYVAGQDCVICLRK